MYPVLGAQGKGKEMKAPHWETCRDSDGTLIGDESLSDWDKRSGSGLVGVKACPICKKEMGRGALYWDYDWMCKPCRHFSRVEK